MTQEDRQLLLKDLCARLPYGVKFKADNEECIREIHYIRDEDVYIREYSNLPYWIDTIKPYLRPISSMTGAEVLEYIGLKEEIVASDDITYSFETYESIDWLNAHHFDYRGLIEKGLAFEAPKDMYKIK